MMGRKENLNATHEKFLESIKHLVIGEFLVGSFVYAEEKNLSKNTDLDLICIVEDNKLTQFLESKFLIGLIDPEVAFDVLNNKISDYLVLKLHIDGILLSVDVISPGFFKKMCNIDLVNQKESYISHKYGNEPQLNKYGVSGFDGRIHNVQKKIKEYRGGYSIELPLFFVSNEGKYLHGIPTIKYITHKIFIDPEKFLEKNLNKFYFNFAKRLINDYPNLQKEKCEEYILNTINGRNKFPEDYKVNLLKKIYYFVSMEKKIDSIRKEVYDLFLDDNGERRYSYVRRDWVFPNHFDVMINLSKEMCKKYGGDEQVCEIAILLHDVGLVYKRESASPEGHEERGVTYARGILSKNMIPSTTSEEIIKCINATDAKEEPESLNAKIVRTADALSQFISVHFFSKAAFSGDWDSYVGWLKKKATNNFKKICFEDEIRRAAPIRDYILNAIALHEKNQVNYPKEENEGENGLSKVD